MKLKYITVFLFIIIFLIGSAFMINLYIKQSTKNQIIDNDDYSKLDDVDCILVLGAAIWKDKPSPMLQDRLLDAIALYKKGAAPKIIMSGEHGR